MANHVAHFGINSDDVERDRAFYESVFGWTFTTFGFPDFYRIETGPAPPGGLVLGAIQARRDLIEGQRTAGFEATISVDDVDATRAAIVDAGGKILMERSTITGVGHLIYFADPSGNPVGAMQYDPTA